jgi:SAM-dependent methyltransferase
MEEFLEWEKCYQENNTPWDKGEPAPALRVLLERNAEAFHGRVLVPGCGTGHDARLIAEYGAKVVAVDIAPTALARARQLDTEHRVEWKEIDLFALPADMVGAFDVVWEHTCLSALEPVHRSKYANALRSALKPGGSMRGVFYINPDLDPGETGPPFGIPVDELIALWENAGLEVVEHWVPDVAYEGREGRECYVHARLRSDEIRP